MSFILANFDKLTLSNVVGAPREYVYGTEDDNLTLVKGIGYFNAVANRFAIGNVILVAATDVTNFDSVTHLKVTAISPDVLTSELVVFNPSDLQTIATTALAAFSIPAATTYLGVTGLAAPAIMTISTAAVLIDGSQLIIKDESGNGGTNTLTIATEGTEQIDGQDTLDIIVDFGVSRLYARGGEWHTM